LIDFILITYHFSLKVLDRSYFDYYEHIQDPIITGQAFDFFFSMTNMSIYMLIKLKEDQTQSLYNFFKNFIK